MPRAVVISGVGVVSGFGVGAQALWNGLLAGRSAIGRIARFDATGMPCEAAAEVADFAVKDYVPKSYRKAVKVMARDIELAVGAAREAVLDAGLVTKGTAADEAAPPAPTYAARRMGCQIGAGLIACETPEITAAFATAMDETGNFSYEKWGSVGMANLTPLWLLKYLPNMLACHVTIIHDAQGPSNTITCADASGLLSIGESMHVIERGDADACFSGGAEAKVNPMGLLRMDLAGRLARLACAPGEESQAWRTVRPFDEQATGSLPGEGGGILILEAEQCAAARADSSGSGGYARVLGFGGGHSPRSGDPALRAEGLIAAIENALDDAKCPSAQIDAIVPNATGARGFDGEVAAALRRVFGARLAEVPLVTSAPAIGDTFAGSGGLLAAIGALCVKHQMLPARLHAGRCPADLRAGPAEKCAARLSRVLVCTPSLGGQNAALVLGPI